jgi:hypothetical protein
MEAFLGTTEVVPCCKASSETLAQIFPQLISSASLKSIHCSEFAAITPPVTLKSDA